jgi:hypothetical protein
MGVALAQAHEHAHLVADVARDAPNTKQANVSRASVRGLLLGVELARAHERAHVAADMARYAPNPEQANMSRACMRKSARIALCELRPIIRVEDEEGERGAKRSVHLDASDDVRCAKKG